MVGVVVSGMIFDICAIVVLSLNWLWVAYRG